MTDTLAAFGAHTRKLHCIAVDVGAHDLEESNVRTFVEGPAVEIGDRARPCG